MSDHLIAEASRHANALPVNPDRMALALALQTIDELERELAEAQAELAALREDKERLDWLAEGDSYGKLASTRRTLPTAAYPTATACDCIRAAIDAAMKEAKP